jgi:hypothetical protein
VRRCAIGALGEFGTQAQAAVSTLLEIRNGKDPEASQLASEALAKIDPDAATRAGVK